MKRLALIVTGDRHAPMETTTPRGMAWFNAVRSVLGPLAIEWTEGVVLIHGACSGIDTIAARAGKRYGLTVLPMPAPWDDMGKRAGPFRNSQMLNVLNALNLVGYETRVIAFHDSLETSKGTKDMVEKAKGHFVPVTVYGSDGKEQTA